MAEELQGVSLKDTKLDLLSHLDEEKIPKDIAELYRKEQKETKDFISDERNRQQTDYSTISFLEDRIFACGTTAGYLETNNPEFRVAALLTLEEDAKKHSEEYMDNLRNGDNDKAKLSQELAIKKRYLALGIRYGHHIGLRETLGPNLKKFIKRLG